MKQYALGLSISLCLSLSPVVYGAENEGLAALLKVLHDNGTLTEVQYQQLHTALNNTAKETEETNTVEPYQDIALNTEGGLDLSTYDGEFSFELGGRLMLDSAFYQQDRAELGNGTELRRARVSMKGTLYSDWDYALKVDFARGNANVKDAYMAYNGWWPWQLKIGQFKEAFSLEELTSSKHSTFMERALVNEFVPSRHIGIAAKTKGSNWTWAGGVFGESFDGDAKNEGDEAWGLSSRLTFAPYHQDRKALHFGAALAYRVPDDAQKIKLNSRPESHITDVKFLDTGSIKNVDNTLLYGLEIAGVWGEFSLQSEYMRMQVNRLGNKENYHFDGFYAYASWFLTGESRAYKFKKAAFGRIKPHHAYGAWELALRYSQLDLNNGNIAGGLEKNWTLGLNWYINKHVRLMANYIRVNNDEYANADDDLSGNDDPGIFQMRMQMDF